MGLNKTEFIEGLSVSYPLESLPKLFAVIETVSKKAFFERMAKLDAPGAEGLSIDQMAGFVHVGLLAGNPGITFSEAKTLVSKFYDQFGFEALENFIIDSFADSGLSDKDTIDKRRALLKELKELDMQRLEYMVHSKQSELEEAEKKIAEKVADMGEDKTKQPLKKKSKT